MNFDFSEDEVMVRDQAARFLSEQCGMSVVREVLDGQKPFSADVWRGLTEMGLTGATIPESLGGVGAGYLSLCLVAQELGASLAPVPFASTIYLAAEALLQFGSEAQQARWLPGIASGEQIGTLAVVEDTREPDPEALDVEYLEGRLNGRKLVVPDGEIADFAVVLAGSPGGPVLALVDLTDAGVSRESIDTIDPTRPAATITFDNTPAESLGDAIGNGWSQLQTVQSRAAVLFAFEQIGGAQKALDMAVAYAKDRFAFGRPIGSFQALKHMMADMYVALKLAESNCYYAAWALSTDAPDLPLAAATARVSATQAFQLCSRDNIQVHGGMGFTWEFDCHLYYRRSNYLTLVLGGLSTWENRLVESLLVENLAPEAAA